MSENNNSKQLTILTIAAVVMSVASLITAVAALYTLKYGNERDEARISRLAAVMEEHAAKKTTTSAATSTRKTGASTSASATSSRATTSAASTSRAQASALARTPEPTPRSGQTGQTGQTSGGTTQGQAGQQATGQGTGQTAAQIRQTAVSTEEQLLDAMGAATDPGANPVDRTEWAVDGKTARTTLSEIARMRNASGQLSLDIADIVQTGDHATATISVAFPGNWGSWTYPNSGFQYVDGKWKLQKSAVCSLAQASLTKCY